MGDGGGGHWLVRTEWRPAGWSVCLPLLIFPCTIKSRSSLLAPAHPGGPVERAVKRLWCGVVVAKYTASLEASHRKCRYRSKHDEPKAKRNRTVWYPATSSELLHVSAQPSDLTPAFSTLFKTLSKTCTQKTQVHSATDATEALVTMQCTNLSFTLQDLSSYFTAPPQF